ncbi:ATP-binding protein, partial [Escherichia coli]|uniref:ATP-binding protein n=1 Tax=Escherichia coli TaxID=562 RepID=UPI00207746CF
RSDLLAIVVLMYQRGSIIVVSQLPVENWYKMIGDSTHADAILDRLRSDLLAIVVLMYQRGSIIVVSQLPVENWYKMIGDSTHADAILDRLVHGSIKIELKGESMRKIQSPLTEGDQ